MRLPGTEAKPRPGFPSEGPLVEELAPLLWIVAIALIFWLLIIRPAQRRQKEIARVQASLAPGERVVLTSGIFATVVEADDAFLMVEVATGVVIKVARAAVGTVIREDDADEADELAAADEADAADETSAEDAATPDVDNEER